MARPEATQLPGNHDTIVIKAPAAAPASGEVLKLADNRVGVVAGLNLSEIAQNDPITVIVSGPFRFTKASAKVFTAGTRPLWDISGNVPLPAGDGGLADGDPVMGTVIGGGANGQTYVDIDLNAVSGTVHSS